MLVLVLGSTAAYLLLAQRHQHWPAARTVSFLMAMTLAILATCSFLGAYAHTLFWALAAQDVVLAALIPVPLALSRPIQLLSRPRRGRTHRPSAFLGSFLVVALLIGIYTSGLDEARLQHPGLFFALQVLLVAAGSGFVGPLFAERGAAYGVRALAALLDGLLDAVPGLVVLASHGRIAASYYGRHPRAWGPSLAQDQLIGGSLMVGLSELVGLPGIVLLLIRWSRSDAEEAAITDLALDEQHNPDGVLQRPWWETDPGPLAERLGRRDAPS